MNTLQIILLAAFIIGFATMMMKLFETPKQVKGGGEKDPAPNEKPERDEKIV